MKIGRTDPCHCGSGKRYKNCCRDKDEAAAVAAAPATPAAPAPAAAEPEGAPPAPKAAANAGKRNITKQTHAKPKGPPPPRPNVVRKHAV